jgi:REP element-mobilizing transposase RayT
MARPLRIEYRGAYYHVTSRGNERKSIFRDDADREKFIELLGRAVQDFDLRLHGYVLMANHYHLLVETPGGGLSRALRYINGVYTQAFNRRHRRAGHLFQGRYKAIVVDKETYLLELSRYIHLNPWRLKRSHDPFKYRWSSLNAYVSGRPAASWLTVREVLSAFGSRGKLGYREFIIDGMKTGIKTPWEEIKGQTVIGSEEFLDEISNKHLKGRGGKGGEQSHMREIIGVKPERVITEVGKHYGIEGEAIRKRGWKYTEARYVASYLMRRYSLMGLREIGERVGLHYSAVGNAVRQVTERPTASQAKSLRELEGNFKNP